MDTTIKLRAYKTHGQKEDFVTLREACVPTEWLVTFLESWKLSVDDSGGEHKRVCVVKCRHI